MSSLRRLGAVAALVALMCLASQAAAANTVQQISIGAFYSMWQVAQAANNTRQQNITILDVRPKTLYQLSHVPDARNVPSVEAKKVASLSKNKKRGVSAKKNIACYCTVSSTALAACNEFAKQKAYAKVKIFALNGGFADWVKAKYPVENGGGNQ